jgi:hypothetical protein
MKKSLLLLSIACFLAISVLSQNGQITNRNTPQGILPNLTADPNSTVVVPLTVNDLFKVTSLSVIYTYDPDILTPIDFSWDGGVLTGTLYNREVNYIGDNQIQFLFTAKSSMFLFTGSGVVGNITFQTGSYGVSPLIFAEFKMNTVTYLSNTVNGEVFISDCFNAVANAGPDASITSNLSYVLQGSAENYSSVEWSTDGDGTFNNTSILKPFYTPGPQDIANGSANLCLTAFGIPPCQDDTDCMTLTILPEAIPQAVMPDLLADPETSVFVAVQANLLQSLDT